MSQTLGFAAEDLARDYLVKQGLKWIKSNFTCKLGEIDLIMRDGDSIVFIEVRARTSNAFGGAVESVTYGKRKKIIKTALLYLSINKLQDKHSSRFDVMCLDGTPPKIMWIKNAFGLDY